MLPPVVNDLAQARDHMREYALALISGQLCCGANDTDPRRNLCGSGGRRTSRPCSRQVPSQKNWFLALDEQVLENASDHLLTLMGYKTQGLGLVYGRSPH